MNKSFFAISGLLVLLGLPVQGYALETLSQSYEAENVYHGTGNSGLTGLYYTISPYASGTGISAGGYLETNTGSGTATTITPFTANIGLGDRLEIGAATRLYSSGAINATGDTDVYAKWNFKTMGEVVPSMALVLGATLPTSTNAAASDVNTIGMHIIFVGGGEAQVTDNMVVGLYGNVGIHAIDPNSASADTYYNVSAGAMVPISDDRRLQAFTDIRFITSKAAATLSGDNGLTAFAGLRFNTKLLKITGGMELKGQYGTRFIGGVTIGF